MSLVNERLFRNYCEIFVSEVGIKLKTKQKFTLDKDFSMSWFKLVYIGLAFFFSSALVVADNQKMVLGNFSQQDKKIPASWDSLTFASIKEHTSYKLVNDQGVSVIKAESMNSASGLTKKIRFNPKDYPYLSWRWKINKTIPGTDVNFKAGDDYAARVYIIFHYELDDLPKREKSRAKMYKFFNGKLPPLATLNYIWGNKSSIGRIVSSPYTNRVKMVILKNSNSALQQWHVEERNIYEDYKAAFGEEPKDVTSIAIMTDTDNTAGMAESFYGDIVVSKMPRFNKKQIEQAENTLSK